MVPNGQVAILTSATASEFRPDIIYDRGNSEWRCCESTEDSLNCQSPSEFVVEAPDPGELSTIIQLTTAGPSSTLMTGTTTLTPSASSAASTTAKASATSTSTSPAIPTSSNLPTSDLSAGAKAGIAIAIIAGIAVVIGGFFYYKIRGVKPSNISTKKHKSEESRNIAMPENPYRPSGAFTKISSQPNSALPSPAIGSGPNSAFPSPAIGSPGFQHDTARESGFSVGLQRDVRRESEFPISLHEQDVGAKRKSRFSYEYDTGPYEMETPTVHHRVPYERPLSAQELEGTRVIVQELDAMPRDKET